MSAAALALLAGLAALRLTRPGHEAVFDPDAKPPEAAPLCPWREPEQDLKRFFPEATRWETQTVILSGSRVRLAERLGRTPTGDENALHVNRVFQERTLDGVVLTRRVKGEHGAIEIVLAIDSGNAVRGWRLQRMREPEPVARALEDPLWQAAFQGKTAQGPWQLGQDLPGVCPEARVSATAVVEGVRSLLVLMETARQQEAPDPRRPLHH